MWSADTHTVSAAASTAPWVSTFVALCALGFTVLSFWWNTWRRGKLVCGYPRTFAATNAEGRTLLLVPLSLRNTGPLSLGVRALRVCLEQDGRAATLHHVLTRTGMRLEDATADFATNFSVEGRSHVLRIAEFANDAELFDFRAGRVHASLDLLYEERTSWTPLRTFELAIDTAAVATILSNYLTYDNAAMLPS